jgi:hypothetical protein
MKPEELRDNRDLFPGFLGKIKEGFAVPKSRWFNHYR